MKAKRIGILQRCLSKGVLEDVEGAAELTTGVVSNCIRTKYYLGVGF